MLSLYFVFNYDIPLAVLFLEFWKRRQFVLQHDWYVLGYEEAEVHKLNHNFLKI